MSMLDGVLTSAGTAKKLAPSQSFTIDFAHEGVWQIHAELIS
jgi:hypothetical protein